MSSLKALLLQTAITAITAAVIHGLHSSWNYDGSDDLLAPENWVYNYSMCSGSNQSPIDIVTASVQPAATGVGLTFNSYSTVPTNSFTLTNTGHTVQVSVNTNTISVTKTGISGNYILEQFHFHWGNANSNGSEHTIDGIRYPLEIHFVHYNNKYGSVSEAGATNDSSAILVLGVFVGVADANRSPSRALEELINVSKIIPYEHNRTSYGAFALQQLMPCGQQPITAYTYPGGLTIPACAEVVNWNVVSQPIYASSDTFAKLREIHGDNPHEELTFNFRPIQPLNGRKVWSYNLPLITCPTTENASSTTPKNGASTSHYGPAVTVAFVVSLLSGVFVFSY